MSFWYNNSNGEQFAGWKVVPQYSCVYDPNDHNGVSEAIDGYHNFSHKPDFAYPYSTDPNVFINVHLRAEPNSFCKDKGNPNLLYAGQKDMDNEERATDGRVDVGADEITCDDVYNPLDWNADGLVNLDEFNHFSKAWLSHDPNEPGLSDPNMAANWNPTCNLDETGTSAYEIDLAALLEFIGQYPATNHWLWKACWLTEQWQTQTASMMRTVYSPEGTVQQNEPILMNTASIQRMAEPPAAQQARSVEQVEAVQPEKSIQEQIADLQEAIQLLESIENDPNNQLEIQISDWQRFMSEIYNSLTELQEKDIMTQDKVEE